MKNFYLILITASIFSACQIEDDNAPSPNESFIKYYGDLAGYEGRDIEMLRDSSGFIVLANVTGESGQSDYIIMRMSLDGTLIDSVEFSFDIPVGFDADGNGNLDDFLTGSDDGGQVEVFDGGFAVIGTTSLNNSALDVLDVQVATITFFDDQFNNLLDTTLVIPASGDLRQGLDLIGSDIITLSDGGFLIMGSIEIERASGVSDFDYYLSKVGSNNNFVEIIGIPGDGNDDILVRGFEKLNGNIVLIGYSSEPSDLGENNGDNGLNVTFSELTPQGKLINRVSYGLDNPDPTNESIFNERVSGAVATSSGFAVVGTTTLTDNEYAFFMNLSTNGVFINGDTLTSTFGFGLESKGRGIVQADDNDFIILGNYPQFNIINNLNQQVARAGEAMFMKVTQFGMPVAGAEVNYGTENGNDEAVDAIALPDGKIVVLANVDFGGGIQLISLIKTNDDGQLEN